MIGVRILIEATIVGIATLALGNTLSFILSKVFNANPQTSWFVLFLTGFLFHFIADITGVNMWYCQNYDTI